MCDVSRRQFLAGGTLLTIAAEAELLGGPVPGGVAQAATADLIAPDVYFHQGNVADNADAVCNNGWIMFEDYVLVVDANYPAGAKLIISNIRSLTDKPIRFAFDTHHHGDHAYGIRSLSKTVGCRWPIRASSRRCIGMKPAITATNQGDGRRTRRVEPISERLGSSHPPFCFRRI